MSFNDKCGVYSIYFLYTISFSLRSFCFPFSFSKIKIASRRPMHVKSSHWFMYNCKTIQMPVASLLENYLKVIYEQQQQKEILSCFGRCLFFS